MERRPARSFVSYSPYGPFALDPFSDSPYISYESYIDLAPRDGSAPWQAPLTGSIDSWGVSANLNIELGDDLALTSITGYREFDGNYSSGDGSPLTPTLQANRVFNRQFSQELRLTGEIFEIVNFTLGGFYFDKQSRNASRITLPTLLFTEENIIPAETLAAFFNVDVAVTDRLNLIFGLRYSDQEKSFRYGRFGVPGSASGGATPPQVAGLNGLVGTFEGERVDYRAVVQYRWSDALMTYAQFSTGFKGGGINPRPFFVTQALPHDPETLEAYEIGFKSDLFDRSGPPERRGLLEQLQRHPGHGRVLPAARPVSARALRAAAQRRRSRRPRLRGRADGAADRRAAHRRFALLSRLRLPIDPAAGGELGNRPRG